jgi:hypothetical protein
MVELDSDLFFEDEVSIIETSGQYYAAGEDRYGCYTIIPVSKSIGEPDKYYVQDRQHTVSINPEDFDELAESFGE